MTPELRRNVADRASDLRGRLNATVHAGGMSPVQAARDAQRIFEDAGDETRLRWLTLELGGYGPTTTRPLHEVLRVAANDRLVAHVAAYRTRRGVMPGPGSSQRVLPHFFVEPLHELVRASDRAARLPAGTTLELDLRDLSGQPMRAQFRPDVFQQIGAGFLAALYLQLAAALR